MRIATLAIITKGDKVLLGLKKGKPLIGKGTLNGPGGHKEWWETLFMCVLRETWEEARVLLNPFRTELAAVITFYAGGAPDFKVHVYRTSSFFGKPHETKSMIPDWYDVTDEDVLDRMLGSDSKWFPQIVCGEKFNANVYYRSRASDFDRIEFLPFAP